MTPKCRNPDCQQRGDCWRYVAPACKWRPYKPFAPGPDGTCADFLPLHGKRPLDETRRFQAP